MAMALIVSCDSKTPEPTPVEPKKNVISIGSETYDSLSDAVKAAKDGDTIEVAEGAYTIDSPMPLIRNSQSKVQVSERLYSTS